LNIFIACQPHFPLTIYLQYDYKKLQNYCQNAVMYSRRFYFPLTILWNRENADVRTPKRISPTVQCKHPCHMHKAYYFDVINFREQKRD